jgi:cell division protein FtsL
MMMMMLYTNIILIYSIELINSLYHTRILYIELKIDVDNYNDDDYSVEYFYQILNQTKFLNNLASLPDNAIIFSSIELI